MINYQLINFEFWLKYVLQTYKNRFQYVSLTGSLWKLSILRIKV